MTGFRSRYVISLCLAATLAVAGCTSSAQPKGQAEEKPVEITLLHMQGMSRPALDEAIRVYNKQHPNVIMKVKEVPLGQQVMQDGKVNEALLDGVDLALVPRDLALNLAKDGAIKDLGSIRMPALNEAVAPLYDELSKLDGKRVALPFDIVAPSILVNEQALTAAGLKTPSQDWTWQEFEQLLTGLKQAGKLPQLSASVLLDSAVGAYGGHVYDSASQRWALDSPEAKQGLAQLARMTQAGLIQADQSGKTVVLMGAGPQAPALIMLSPKISIRAPGVKLPLPKGPKGRATGVSATVGAVMAASAHADVAMDFLRMMVGSEEGQTALAKGGIRPVIVSSKAMAAWQEAVGDKATEAAEAALQGAFPDAGVSYAPVMQALTPYLQGKATLEQVLPGLLAQTPH
jgi:multiple sugar transport system substrate-binding protein